MKDQLQYHHSATFQDTGGALPSNVLIKDYPELGCLIIGKDSWYFLFLHKDADYRTWKVFRLTMILIAPEYRNKDIWLQNLTKL